MAHTDADIDESLKRSAAGFARFAELERSKA